MSARADVMRASAAHGWPRRVDSRGGAPRMWAGPKVDAQLGVQWDPDGSTLQSRRATTLSDASGGNRGPAEAA